MPDSILLQSWSFCRRVGLSTKHRVEGNVLSLSRLRAVDPDIGILTMSFGDLSISTPVFPIV